MKVVYDPGSPEHALAECRLATRVGDSYAQAMALFALTMVSGPNFDASRRRREQDAWDEHATFMDSLVEAGFVILGGPIGDGTRILLVVEAADQPEIEMRLGEDPWAPMGLLRIGEIQPWTIWLDGRQPDLKH